MSNRAIQRVFLGAAMAAVLTLAGLTTTESVAAQQPIDDRAQRQQPVQDQEDLREMNEMMDQTNDGDDDMTWGWVGLLGLAGLLGLRRRDDGDARHVSGTTRHSQT